MTFASSLAFFHINPQFTRIHRVMCDKGDYVAENKPQFTLATMCPPLVVGAPIHPVSTASLNTSLLGIYRLMSGQTKDVFPGGLGFVAVQDLAKAHLLAFEKEEAGGSRFLVSEGWHSWQEVSFLLQPSFFSSRSID